MAGSQIIQSLKSKLDRLVQYNRKLRGECDALIAQRDKLSALNGDLQSKLTRMENRIAVLELKDGLSAGGSKIARARVNRLMREVDKCLALLRR